MRGRSGQVILTALFLFGTRKIFRLVSIYKFMDFKMRTIEKIKLNNKEVSVSESDMKSDVKPYTSPRLMMLGDVCQITQGGSAVTEDSGQGSGTGPNIP